MLLKVRRIQGIKQADKIIEIKDDEKEKPIFSDSDNDEQEPNHLLVYNDNELVNNYTKREGFVRENLKIDGKR